MASCRCVISVMIVFVATQGLLSAANWVIDEPSGAQNVDMGVSCGGSSDSLNDQALEVTIWCQGVYKNHAATSYVAMTRQWGPETVDPPTSGFVVGNADCKLFNFGDDPNTGTPLKTKAFTFTE